MKNTVKENVAEHSFHVALLTHVLCSIGNEMFQRNVPTEKAVTLALFHDATEVFTGDIPTPVKHHNPNILNSFREIERIAADRLFNMIPHELKVVYQPLVKNTKDDDLFHWVKAADLLDAYLKCITELSGGNREFAVAKKQIEQGLQSLNMPEIQYFLTHLAPSFEKTLDEISE